MLAMQKERNLIVALLMVTVVGFCSCAQKRALREIPIDPNARLDRLFVTFNTDIDTALWCKKFRKFDMKIIDFQSHLNIACMSYDSSKVSPQLITYKLKKRKEITKVAFDRNYTP